MRDEAGPFGVNAVTLLASLTLVLILVMGGFTLSSSQGGMEQAQPTEPTGAYAVTINESTVVVRNVDGDPAVYDQLVVYVSTDNRSQRLDLDEGAATGDDGDMLFERDETAVRALNASIEAETPVTISLVDEAGSDIRFRTTVNVTAGSVP